jgi:hypothetical protein
MGHAFRERVVASLRRTWGRFGAAPGLAADALYTPAGGGAPVALRVMPVVKDAVLDDFGGRTLQTGRSFDLLTSDVPARPEKGATLALLDGAGNVMETCTLTEPALSIDSLRAVWRCVTGEPA